jgi:quercetin dioxygenase-like cupin family protein
MQRVSTVFEPFRNRLTRTSGTIAATALAATLLLSSVAQAQDATPSATPEASPVAVAEEQAPAEITTLFSHTIESFPEAPVSVRLLRMTLQPGASSPMHTHPGEEFDFVISGTLTVNSEGDATVVSSSGDEVTRALSGDQLVAGDMINFPAGIGMNLINDSDEELVLYSAVFHPINEDVPSTVYTEGDPAPGAFDGLTYEVLGDGQINSFPSGEATVTLDELVIPAGTDLPAQEGASLYSQVDGEFAFAVQEGSVQVSRTDSPGLRPNAAPEQEFTLAPGDGAFFPAGLDAASRADQPGELSILRLSAVPSEPIDSQPAMITFLESEAEPVEEEEAFTEIAIGATVVTNAANVNVRAEPSLEGEAVEQLAEGTELTVVDGPQEGDEYTWWQVETTGDDPVVLGWLASDLIELVGGAPEAEATEEPTEEPAADEATPAASPEAETDAEFQEGDIVVMTQDNVRIRGEASINAEPIDVFLEGTEFEVTGEPVEADEFTWYPVTLVADDSISGWIAADFIEPAPEDDEDEG